MDARQTLGGILKATSVDRRKVQSVIWRKVVFVSWITSCEVCPLNSLAVSFCTTNMLSVQRYMSVVFGVKIDLASFTARTSARQTNGASLS